MNKRPPYERIPKIDHHLNPEGKIKPTIFNAAMHRLEEKLPWLAHEAARGHLTDAQLEECRELVPDFDKAVKKSSKGRDIDPSGHLI